MSASGVGCSRVFSDRPSRVPGCPLLLSLASLLLPYSLVSTHRRSWRLVPDRRTYRDSSLRTRGAPVTTRLREERRVRARQVCVCCWCEPARPAYVGRTHGAWRSLPCRGLLWQQQQQRRPTHMRRVLLERMWAITWRCRWPVCPSAGRPAQAPMPSAPGHVPCSTGGDRRAAAGPQAAQAPRPGSPAAGPGCPTAQAGQGAGPAACGVQPPGRAPPTAPGRCPAEEARGKCEALQRDRLALGPAADSPPLLLTGTGTAPEAGPAAAAASSMRSGNGLESQPKPFAIGSATMVNSSLQTTTTCRTCAT